ncbi:MAG TPA: OmpH family outer membrane protein [Phycisphaerales bacterium]|nr:OmpH family outer membrane protein [Phycisphaerales bacterium]
MTRRSLRTSALLLAVAAGSMAGGVLASRTSSPAFAQGGPAPASVRIATVDVLAVVERMILSPKYAPAREKLQSERSEELRELSDRMRALETRARDMKPETEEFKTLAAEFQGIEATFQQRQQAAHGELEALNVKDLTDAYRDVFNAAHELARTQGYTHVIATRAGEPVFRSNNAAGVVQEMIARPVLVGVPGDDITQRLVEKLNLQDVQVTPLMPPAAAQPQAPAAQPSTPAPSTPTNPSIP